MSPCNNHRWTMSDANCPYCNAEVEINHDDGYGREEDQIHQQECHECGKTFTYTTFIHFSYDLEQAPCLNEGGSHNFKPMRTYPACFTELQCTFCGERKQIECENGSACRVPEGSHPCGSKDENEGTPCSREEGHLGPHIFCDPHGNQHNIHTWRSLDFLKREKSTT